MILKILSICKHDPMNAPDLSLSLSLSPSVAETGLTMSKKGRLCKYVKPLINSFEGELPTIATPTKVLTENGAKQFSASELTINKKDKVGENDHFQTTPIPPELWEMLKENVKKYQMDVLCDHLGNDVSSLPLRHSFNACKAKIHLLCDHWPAREMELRYAVVDPLMEMICDIWTLKVRCEYCYCNVINPRACAEGYGTRFVCVSVCLFVCLLPRDGRFKWL